VSRTRFNQEVAPEEVHTALADQVIRLVEPVMKPLRLDLAKKPFVILVVGVNGSGKTTTIAELPSSSGTTVTRSCSLPATRSARRRSSNCRSGASVPAAL
jgi:signal recognition particle GTPase